MYWKMKRNVQKGKTFFERLNSSLQRQKSTFDGDLIQNAVPWLPCAIPYRQPEIFVQSKKLEKHRTRKEKG
jgi:hypothetical protein